VLLYDGWRASYAASDTNYTVYVGFLQFARFCEACLRAHTDFKLWRANLAFNPQLLISTIQLLISTMQLLEVPTYTQMR
jgi:hypothetical protein